MIVWSGWGICVVLIGAIGLLVGVTAAGAFAQWLPYGPAQSVGISIGGLLAASGIHLFAKWRDSGEARVLIDEATGQRIEVRPSAGSLFFIPTRFWTWITLALSALFAFTTYSAVAPAL